MTNLVWETSRNGARVPSWKGRLLASRLDPHTEARDWILQRLAFLEKVKTVFVLGLGGGFHVREILLRSTARVIVIERESEITAAVMPALVEEFGSRVTALVVERASDLRGENPVREALQGSFVSLEHPASVAGAREFYSDCSALLAGREWGALTWQWRLKGFADFDPEPRVARSEKALTIHDLEETELVRNSVERERLLLKALRELVK